VFDLKVLNEIAALELGATRRVRRLPDPNRNKAAKVRRLAARRGIGLGAALAEYNQKHRR